MIKEVDRCACQQNSTHEILYLSQSSVDIYLNSALFFDCLVIQILMCLNCLEMQRGLISNDRTVGVYVDDGT